jgi:hypothetical protein
VCVCALLAHIADLCVRSVEPSDAGRRVPPDGASCCCVRVCVYVDRHMHAHHHRLPPSGMRAHRRACVRSNGSRRLPVRRRRVLRRVFGACECVCTRVVGVSVCVQSVCVYALYRLLALSSQRTKIINAERAAMQAPLLLNYVRACACCVFVCARCSMQSNTVRAGEQIATRPVEANV